MCNLQVVTLTMACRSCWNHFSWGVWGSLQELFDLLDDGDGGIHTAEFFHGLARMKGGAPGDENVGKLGLWTCEATRFL